MNKYFPGYTDKTNKIKMQDIVECEAGDVGVLWMLTILESECILQLSTSLCQLRCYTFW